MNSEKRQRRGDSGDRRSLSPRGSAQAKSSNRVEIRTAGEGLLIECGIFVIICDLAGLLCLSSIAHHVSEYYRNAPLWAAGEARVRCPCTQRECAGTRAESQPSIGSARERENLCINYFSFPNSFFAFLHYGVIIAGLRINDDSWQVSHVWRTLGGGVILDSDYTFNYLVCIYTQIRSNYLIWS